jgi:hypothetical protein
VVYSTTQLNNKTSSCCVYRGSEFHVYQYVTSDNLQRTSRTSQELSFSVGVAVCVLKMVTPSDRTPVEVAGELCGKRNLEHGENDSVLIFK